MTTWIALFRGINVGGNNILKMADLRHELESLNCQHVRTYIQSGNVVFDSTARTAKSLVKKIERRIESQHGFRPRLFILSQEELSEAIASNPFPQAVTKPSTLHFCFLEGTPVDPDIRAIECAKAPSETYRLTERVFYLHAPDGIGRSKLAANVEKHLGVAATGRNYRTVDKLSSMVSQTEK